MEANLLQFTIVIRGESHNPTILNPDFLAIQGIVPSAWGWKIDQPAITTPMMAMVKYANGVLVQVDGDSLQLVASGPGISVEDSKIPEIARSYVSTLPHVRYTAMGFNFQSSVLVEAPETIIRDRYLKSGRWGMGDTLEGAGVRLLYPLEPNGRLVVSIDGGQVNQRDKEGKQTSRAAILVHANFHRKLTKHPATGEICKYLDGLLKDWAKYQTIITEAVLSEA